jgi:hypothetical protein
LGRKILYISKKLLFWLANFAIISRKVLLRILDFVLYNPLVRRAFSLACLFVFITGAFFLVFFAIASPELPPENLISTINDISSRKTSGNSGSQVILLANETNWAALTAFTDAELETGAGSALQDRTQDIEYPIRPGETLSEIAYAYEIPYNFLAWYNKINNPNRIRVDTVITIPSLENIVLSQTLYEQEMASQPQPAPAKAARSIEISYESHNNGSSGITVHFSIVNPPSDLRSYEWDLGDGRRSFRENPSYEYSTPKTYVIRLTAQDSTGIIYRSNALYIDIPHPASAVEYSTTKFVTLSSPDEYFFVRGTITKVARYSDINAAPLDFSETDQFMTKVRFQRSGYYGITVEEPSGREQYYSIFVSPVPTVHVDYSESSFNWYRTQFGTGESNCGPASVSMAIGWGSGMYFPVYSVRQAIGWQGDGGTSFEELIRVIRNQGIAANIQPLRTVQDIKNVIDSGSIAIILFHTGGVRLTRNASTDLVGKYYNDSVGHYVVVKGYSLDGQYFVIHDPIPNDWSSNSFRYGDEISMIGRNRYYHSVEILRSLRRMDMIVVPGGH